MSSATVEWAVAEDREHPVIFFDGVCGLCNRFVDFVLRRDAAGVFRFAPLQGTTAQEKLDPKQANTLQTVVLLNHRGRFCRSAAVVRVLWHLGGWWKFAGCLLWLVPAPLRDLGYKMIASRRYRLFGQREACRLPGPGEQERFLP